MTDKIISQDSEQSYLFKPPIITPQVWSALIELFYIAAVFSEMVSHEHSAAPSMVERLSKVNDELKAFFDAQPFRSRSMDR